MELVWAALIGAVPSTIAAVAALLSVRKGRREAHRERTMLQRTLGSLEHLEGLPLTNAVAILYAELVEQAQRLDRLDRTVGHSQGEGGGRSER